MWRVRLASKSWWRWILTEVWNLALRLSPLSQDHDIRNCVLKREKGGVPRVIFPFQTYIPQSYE